MKKITLLVLSLILGSVRLWATPSQITFQGTLKQKGVPVNTTKNMQFSFVDAAGSSIPGTSPLAVANVQVTNGLFAVQLPIDPKIPWEQYTPFIQVSVEGQILSPNQPMNANLYAIAAIPQGLVAIFPTDCPIGWNRFSALDNVFPMGGVSYGTTGGSATHSHSITTDGAHNHGGLTGFETIPGDPRGDNGAVVSRNHHQHPISMDGAHNHGGATGPASSLPPYVTVVFCQKL